MMPLDSVTPATDALDEVLLGVATFIEPSQEDRSIAEARYRRLKSHLERDGSPLAPYLVEGESLIYAQGSIAISTMIISGTEDDRFDVDAMVEIDVPPDWPESRVLDLLEAALQGFPGAVKIVRCTRCVQIQFANMHMDVAIIDRRARIPGERPGEIFHSPDEGRSYRVPSNPWGFTAWFRSVVVPEQTAFAERIAKARAGEAARRLGFLDLDERLAIAAAEQEELPPTIPSQLDAQEAVALKLLKRAMNMHYEDLALKRPPSIYLTKKTGDLGLVEGGLSMQLGYLAAYIAHEMRGHLAAGSRPEEENPSYPPDKINDRWPRAGAEGNEDMETLAVALEDLIDGLNRMAQAPLDEIMSLVDRFFGERVGQQQRMALAKRYDRRDSAEPLHAQAGTGQVVAPAVVVASENMEEIPRHRFHCSIIKAPKDGDGD